MNVTVTLTREQYRTIRTVLMDEVDLLMDKVIESEPLSDNYFVFSELLATRESALKAMS